MQLAKIYNYRQSDSIAANLRNQRFNLFKSLLETLPSPIRILDVGGRVNFWEYLGLLDDIDDRIEITILNISEFELEKDLAGKQHPRLKRAVGDARNMPEFCDREFDVVFSNSVIEHVGNYENQRKFAQEVQRVGKRCFIQTPYYYFPIEPHFLFPGFQWLPIELRVRLAANFPLGWYGKFGSLEAARAEVTSIELLTRRKLTALFPDATMLEEKIFGLTKGLIVHQGW